MSVDYRILPHLGLLVVQFADTVTTHDSLWLLREYGADPGFDPGHRALIDMTDMTAVDVDWPAFLQIMAQAAEVLPGSGPERFIVYIAPTPLARDHAQRVARTWEGIPGVTVRVLVAEEEALAVLGLTVRTVAELLTAA